MSRSNRATWSVDEQLAGLHERRLPVRIPESLLMSDDIKRIDVAEFRRLGFLQEVNRRVLHPAGLALEVILDEDGVERFGGCWDYRDDPEGITFGAIDESYIASVDAEIEKHADVRRELLGGVIQTQPDTP